MKKSLLRSALVCLTIAQPLFGKAASVVIDPLFQGKDKEGLGAFALEIAQAELSGDSSLRLVERKTLTKILEEQGLGASGMGDSGSASAIGKILSANYLVSVKGIVAGERMMMVTRVVEVETSLFKSKTIQVAGDADVEALANELTEAIKTAIATLDADALVEDSAPKAEFTLADTVERPRIAIYIPEATDGQSVRVDPACEHRLMDELLKHKFPVTQLEYSSHALTFGQNGRPQGEAFEGLMAAARAKNIEVLIIGEAFSQRAGALGPLMSSRARVEMHSVKVSDQSILNSISRYGTAADPALAIAGKKAIEDATDRAFVPFATELMKAL